MTSLRLTSLRLFFFFFLLLLALATAEPKKIFFIGNNYTGGTKAAVTQLIMQSSQSDTELTFIHRDSKTLEFHLSNQATIDKIKEGRFAFVVLQDQTFFFEEDPAQSSITSGLTKDELAIIRQAVTDKTKILPAPVFCSLFTSLTPSRPRAHCLPPFCASSHFPVPKRTQSRDSQP